MLLVEEKKSKIHVNSDIIAAHSVHRYKLCWPFFFSSLLEALFMRLKKKEKKNRIHNGVLKFHQHQRQQ